MHSNLKITLMQMCFLIEENLTSRLLQHLLENLSVLSPRRWRKRHSHGTVVCPGGCAASGPSAESCTDMVPPPTPWPQASWTLLSLNSWEGPVFSEFLWVDKLGKGYHAVPAHLSLQNTVFRKRMTKPGWVPVSAFYGMTPDAVPCRQGSQTEGFSLYSW